MLVLKRKVGQTVIVDHEMVVTVLEVEGSYVRLGFDGPRDMKVDRGEIHDVCLHPVKAHALRDDESGAA